MVPDDKFLVDADIVKLILTVMKAIMKFNVPVMVATLLLITGLIQAQTDKKTADLKKFETAVNTAKSKIALNERQLDISDSLINAGTQLILDSKAETKAIGAERKKLDKEYSTNHKALIKLSASKDKEEALKAKSELKALDTQYKLDTKALDNRLKDANKKSATGSSNLSKGKTSGKSAEAALKSSQAALEVAQEKYDVASGN